MAKFEREAKMKTTEPSDNETKIKAGRIIPEDEKVKFKKGGHTKKHMALGGAMGSLRAAPMSDMAAKMAAARASGASMMRSPIANPNPGMPAPAMAKRKKGGSIGNEKAELRRVKSEIKEDRKEERNEHEEIGRVKKELKHHESLKANKAHMMKGGKAHAVPGGLLGGVEDYRAHSKAKTGDIEGPGYRRGGKIQKDTVASEAKTKVVGAKQRKSISSKTSGLEGVGYKKGGSVAKYENTLMHGGPKMPTKKLGTGEIKQSPAGYKHGGHVSMACKGGEAHKPMKKGGSW